MTELDLFINMDTQEGQILEYLKSGKSLTPLEALDLFKCFRLASRISDLKRKGYDIKSKMVLRNGKRYSEYSIESGLNRLRKPAESLGG